MKRTTTILRTVRRNPNFFFFSYQIAVSHLETEKKKVKYYLAVFYQTCLFKPVLEETSDVGFRVGWVVAPFALT